MAANKTAYFEPSYLQLRERLLTALTDGTKPELTANQWSPITVGRLSAAVGVAEAALDAAKAHTHQPLRKRSLVRSVSMFLEETRAVQAYKDRVVQSRAEDTVYTLLFDVGWPNAAHRVLRNKVIAEWEAAGRPATGERPGEGSIIGAMPVAGASVDMVKYMVFSPLTGFTGDIDNAALYAGESCSLVHDIKPAAQIVRDVMREAEEAMEELKHLA